MPFVCLPGIKFVGEVGHKQMKNLFDFGADPSIFLNAGAYPSCHLVKGRPHPIFNLESAVNLTWVFVDCARKSEYLEEKAQGEDEKTPHRRDRSVW